MKTWTCASNWRLQPQGQRRLRRNQTEPGSPDGSVRLFALQATARPEESIAAPKNMPDDTLGRAHPIGTAGHGTFLPLQRRARNFPLGRVRSTGAETNRQTFTIRSW